MICRYSPPSYLQPLSETFWFLWNDEISFCALKHTIYIFLQIQLCNPTNKRTENKNLSAYCCWNNTESVWEYLQVAGSGRVAGHSFGRKVEVWVRAIEEGLAALTVGKVGLKYQTRTRASLRVQWTATHRQAILHIKTTEKRKRREKKLISILLFLPTS